MQFDGGYVFNEFDAATYRLKTPTGNNFTVKVTGDAFTGNGKIKFAFRMKETEKLSIKLRIPNWSKQTKVFVAGEEMTGVEANSYLDIQREFSNGDCIEIALDNSFTVVKQDGKTLLKKGAYVLARDERYQDGFDDGVKVYVSRKGEVKAKKVQTNTFNCLGEFSVKTKDGKRITLCDYASAGKNWDNPDNLRITAWI